MKRQLSIGKSVSCPKCKKHIYESHLRRHMDSQKCQNKTRINAVIDPVTTTMAARNWVLVGHNGFKKTLRRAGIPLERAASYADVDFEGELFVTDSWWAPDWAVAIVSAGGSTKDRKALLQHCLTNKTAQDAAHAMILMGKDRKQVVRMIIDSLCLADVDDPG